MSRLQLGLDVFWDGWRFYNAVEYSDQTQDEDDDLYRFAQKLTRLEEEGDKVTHTTNFSNQEIELVGENIGKPSYFGLTVPFSTQSVKVTAVIEGEASGTLTYDNTGFTSLAPYGDGPLDSATGTVRYTQSDGLADAGKQELSYMAHQIRQLVVEAYGTYVGERRTPPGISMEWDEVKYFAKRAWDLAKFANKKRKGRNQNQN